LLPDISKMYFMSLSSFLSHAAFWRVHSLVGAASPFSTCPGKFSAQKKLTVRCQFQASSADLSMEAQR
jgi:hypothetical protein